VVLRKGEQTSIPMAKELRQKCIKFGKEGVIQVKLTINCSLADTARGLLQRAGSWEDIYQELIKSSI
jgi:hypothetical protein